MDSAQPLASSSRTWTANVALAMRDQLAWFARSVVRLRRGIVPRGERCELGQLFFVAAGATGRHRRGARA